MFDLVVAISGYQDEGLLVGAVDSVRAAGWPIAYCDGAYLLAHRRGEPWQSDADAVRRTLKPHDLFVPAAPDGPWPSEAEKRDHLMAAIRSNYPSRWALWLDCDERLEMPSGAAAAAEWLKETLSLKHLAASVNLWEPQHEKVPGERRLPRLVNVRSSLRFQPPRDFDLAINGECRVWPGMNEEEALAVGPKVPANIIRIRHDRHLKTADQFVRAGEYCQRRRAAHPQVCA